jgi:trigger factor
VSVDEAHMQKKMREAARKLSKEVRIPGFRKGKMPYPVLVKRIGEANIRAEAIDDMTQVVFEAMLDQLEEKPYTRSSLQDIQMNPTVFTFTVPLSPIVKLGDYRSARQEVDEIVITEEAVEEALERIQERHVVLEPVERPADVGDMVTVKGTGTVTMEAEDEDGEDEVVNIFKQDSGDLLLDPDKLVYGQPFVDHIVGMSKDDEKSFAIVLSEDFPEEEIAGKTAMFNVTVLDIKNRILPAIDDELAKEEGEYETLAELRDAVEKDLHKHALQHAKSDRMETFIDQLMEEAKINFPPALIQEELDDMIANLRKQMENYGWDWEDYLRLQETTEEDMREDLEESAEQRVERGLVLSQFVQDEKLKVTDAALDAKFDEQYGNIENEEVRQYMKKFMMEGGGINTVINEIIMDAAYERVLAIWSGTAPSFEELEAADEEE